MALQLGKANYTNNNSDSTKLVYHKLGHKDPKQRKLLARLAPPLGHLADKGVWQRYIKQHFGYGVPFVNNKGEKRVIPTTYLCIEKKDRTGNITQHCPECDEIKRHKDKVEEKTAELKAQGKTQEEIKAALKYLTSWLKDHNLDKKWHMVAKDPGGQWGFLTISHTCYKLLYNNNPEAPGVIQALLARDIDPLSAEKGVWFQFTRNGSDWNDIKDIPTVAKEERTVNGETMEVTKFDALTQADLEALEKLPSLDSLGRTLTFDQIQMLVTSGGDEATVRAVMNMPVQNPNAPASTTKSAPVVDEPSDEEVSPEGLPVAPAATKPAQPAATPAAAPAEDDEEAAALAALAAIKAKKAAKATAAATPAAAPATTPVATGQLKADVSKSMEDFIKEFQ